MRIINLKSVLLFMIVLILLAGQTDSAEISGTITDSKNGDRIIGASIAIIGTNLGGITDFDGYYKIRNVKLGSCKLKISAVGYESIEIENVVVNNNFETVVDRSLVSTSSELEKIIKITRDRIHKFSSGYPPLSPIDSADENKTNVLYTLMIEMDTKNQHPDLGTIIGVISDVDTEKTGSNSLVKIDGTEFKTVTDRYGRFTFEKVDSGIYTLIFYRFDSEIGESRNISVKQGFITELGIEMKFDFIPGFGGPRDVFVRGSDSSSLEEFRKRMNLPGLLEGLITNKVNGESIVGASIAVVGTNHGGISKTEGIFKTTEIPSGIYKIIVSSIGYKTKEIDNIRIYREFSVYYNFKMEVDNSNKTGRFIIEDTSQIQEN